MNADQLKALFAAGVAAADPLRLVPPHLPPAPAGRAIVVGAGKAAATMARAVDDAWAKVDLEGMVVTRYGHGVPARRISVIEAGHPVPDAAGVFAARQIAGLVERAAPEDLVLVLISGGASSLLALPVDGIEMDDLRNVTQQLLRSGAPITDMNCVRKHLSRIAGGRLAERCLAHMVCLMISDVPGDDPSVIGSGPTSPDPTHFADAHAVLARYGVEVPASVRAHLDAGMRGDIDETPKPGSACFARVDNRVIATASAMLGAVQTVLIDQGFNVENLGEIEGEARDVAQAHAHWLAQRADAVDAPGVALLSGGECTVTVTGDGRGGRCTEYLLHLGMAVDSLGLDDRFAAIACDTDGIDGSEKNAGAVWLPGTATRARSMGLEASHFASRNDAWGFFNALGQLVTTGPTRTNVNDLRVAFVLPA